MFVITALAATQLSHLRFDISAQSMMVESDPAWLDYQKSLDTFGSDNTVILFVKDDQLLSKEKLTLLKNAITKIKQLPFVNSVKSLFNIPNVKEVDEYIITDAFFKDISNTPEEFAQILNDAKQNPLVAQNFISDDGKSLSINISIGGAIHKVASDHMIATDIEKIIQPLSSEFDSIFQMGASYIRDSISQQIQKDQLLIVPMALLVLILVLGISLKHINYAIVPILTASISIVLTLSVMAFLDIPINVLTSIVPALILIIGSTEDIHLMSDYQQSINRGLSKSTSVTRLSKNQALAITLTFITTFIGFLSITINDLDILSQFGWVASMGLFFNFIITTLFVPAYLKLFGSKKSQLTLEDNFYERMSLAIFNAVIRFKKTALFFILITSFIFIWGAQFVRVNNNTLEFFQHSSDVYQRAETLHSELSGMQTFSVILESNIVGTFQKVKYLEEIAAIQHKITSMGVFDQSFSFANFMMLTNKVMEGNNDLSLPVEDETVQAYLSIVDHDLFKDYVSDDLSSARILVRHHISSSYELKQTLNQLQQFIDNDLKSKLNVYFTGESILTNNAADMMAISQIQSLLLMVVVILLLVSALFIDIRAGILALIPNVFPVIILFGVMGYFKIPLDTGTTMVAIIALGICVDDTIHFLSRYHQLTRGEQNIETALYKTAKHEATPISTTSIALAAGFATLTLSSFQPVIHFGALSALVMLLALFSTLVLTPILLSYTRLITAWDMMQFNLKNTVINDSTFFKGLNSFEIKKAILSGEVIQFNKGDIIIEQDSAGTDFYVILEGEANVTHKDSDGSIHTIGKLGTGDLFGEISQLTGQTRTARVTSNQYTKSLKIKWDSLYQLGRFHPRISLKLYRNMSTVLGKRMAMKGDQNSRIRDELTGAVTKPFLLEQLKIETDRAKRYKEPFSCIILDIDFLTSSMNSLSKNSDEISMKALTKIISFQMRSVDIFARWSNTQFIVVMPRTTSESSIQFTQRIKRALENNDVENMGRVHMSAAITESIEDENINHILSRLEDSLNDLKLTGKSLHITTT